MQLGKTLVGAIIGGALGIVVLLFVQHHHGWDGYWMALPVALLTGLGVRLAAKVKGHPSYLRGALTGLLSIALFIAGQYVVAQVVTRGAAAKPVPTQESVVRPAADEANTENEAAAIEEPAAAPQTQDQEAAEPAADEQAAPADDERTGPVEGVGQAPMIARTPLAKQWTTMDLLWLCIAALIGYSLGRGSEPSSKNVETRDDNAPAAPNRSMPPSD
jgi:hypothetical protein